MKKILVKHKISLRLGITFGLLLCILPINTQAITVKTVHACQLRSFLSNLRVPNAEVWKQVTKIGAKCYNIPADVRANLSNFIQDLFWLVRFSNENFKVVDREVFKGRFPAFASLAIVKI